jgi:hypothetical protein
MLGGIGIGLLSGAKNKKIVTIIGAIMAVVGIGGMTYIGSQVTGMALGEFGDRDIDRSYFYTQYAFLFTLIAGLVLAIAGATSIHRSKRQASP